MGVLKHCPFEELTLSKFQPSDPNRCPPKKANWFGQPGGTKELSMFKVGKVISNMLTKTGFGMDKQPMLNKTSTLLQICAMHLKAG